MATKKRKAASEKMDRARKNVIKLMEDNPELDKMIREAHAEINNLYPPLDTSSWTDKDWEALGEECFDLIDEVEKAFQDYKKRNKE
jgi:hypothetical protein